MSSLFENPLALPGQGRAPVPVPHQAENECERFGRTLGDIRQNGLERGWRRKDERQELTLPLRVIACNTPHSETLSPLLL